MTTYEITPDPSISGSMAISYQATGLDNVYATLRDIARLAGETGAIYLCGSHATVDNRLIARVRQTAPWYSTATDSWVGFDTDGNVRPVNR